MVVSSPLFCIKLGQQKQFPLLLLAYQINCEIIRYKLSFLRHPVQCTWYIVHTYIFLGYDILFLRYIPAGSDLELECQVDLGDHGPDDHYRYLCFSFFCLHVLCMHACLVQIHLCYIIISVLYTFACCRQTAVLHWLVNGRVLDPGKEGEQEKRVTASQRIAGYLFQVCVLYSFDLSQPSIPLISWI